MEQEKLNEIIASHGRWVRNKGGERANLSGEILIETDMYGANLCRAKLCHANLSHTDLHYANLSHANLCHADMCHANLSYADLRCVDLCHADLRGASLVKADLRGANLCQANLRGAKLPTGMYQVVGAGSCNRCTTYDVINDQIVCGCWDDGAGNHLDSFTLRVESIYGPNGEKPNSVYYAEYMSAINFFRAMKELNKKS